MPVESPPFDDFREAELMLLGTSRGISSTSACEEDFSTGPTETFELVLVERGIDKVEPPERELRRDKLLVASAFDCFDDDDVDLVL